MKNKFVFIPEVNHSGSNSGDNETEDRMWDSVSENDTELSLAIRELVQNSIDAQNDSDENKICKVKVILKTIDLSFIDSKGLIESIENCIKNSNKEGTINKMREFKENATKDFSNVQSLIIEDESGGLDGESRFEECGLQDILNTNSSRKDDSNLGSFGVGKSTAIRLSNCGTVYYLNQRGNIKRLIGKSVLSGWQKDGAFYGPQIFCGLKGKNYKTDVAKYGKFDDKNKIRSFEKDGLTTIIPIDKENLNKNGLEWMEIASYSSIKSYFKSFEQNTLEITIKDDINNNKITINKSSYKEVYNKILGKIEDNSALDPTFKHDIQILRPAIIGSEKISTRELDVSLNFTKKMSDEKESYSGKLIIDMYENEDINNLIEDFGLDRDRAYNFRLIRGNILIRNYKLPNYKQKKKLPSNLYCGLVSIIKTNNKNSESLDKLIRELETQSHDSLDVEKKLLKKFNQESTHEFKSKFTAKLNKIILEMINEQVNKDSEKMTEIEINLDLDGNHEGSNSDGGYNREVTSIGAKRKISQTNSSSTIKGQGDGEETVSGTVGDGDETVLLGGIGGNGGGGGGNRHEIENEGFLDEEGKGKVILRTSSQSINSKSKRILKKGKNAKYILKCDNLKNASSLHFYQDAIDGHKNSARMFDIKSVKIDNVKIPKKSITGNDKFQSVDYDFKKLTGQIIEVELTEPEKSITDFHLKAIK